MYRFLSICFCLTTSQHYVPPARKSGTSHALADAVTFWERVKNKLVPRMDMESASSCQNSLDALYRSDPTKSYLAILTEVFQPVPDEALNDRNDGQHMLAIKVILLFELCHLFHYVVLFLTN